MPDIQPGSTVTIQVTKTPNSASARKTVVRLLSKDADVIKRNQKLAHTRATAPEEKQRGGRVRVWSTRHPKLDLVHALPGEKATFTLGYQELRDLASVEKYLKVSKG